MALLEIRAEEHRRFSAASQGAERTVAANNTPKTMKSSSPMGEILPH